MTKTSYRQEIERLLQQIGEYTRELHLLKTYGARSAALRTKKKELRQVRLELAQLVR
ncbi:MAG: hypothetical protein ACRDL2_13220 [Gaiellaceae bacterium]